MLYAQTTSLLIRPFQNYAGDDGEDEEMADADEEDEEDDDLDDEYVGVPVMSAYSELLPGILMMKTLHTRFVVPLRSSLLASLELAPNF